MKPPTPQRPLAARLRAARAALRAVQAVLRAAWAAPVEQPAARAAAAAKAAEPNPHNWKGRGSSGPFPHLEMKMDNQIELRDTRIRFELELTHTGAIPKANSDSDPEASKDKVFPYTSVSKVFVGDEQIGLITSLNIAQDAEQVLPLIEVHLAKGSDGREMTPELKESLAKYAAMLRQFPFVQVHVPMVPVV